MSKFTLPAYLTATGASLFGNAAIAIVLPWLVLERTGNPALAGIVAAISAAPGAVAAFASGHLIDRFGRRRMSVLADIGSAAAVAALAMVDLTVGLDLMWFIVLGVLGALFDVPGMTARETLMADVADSSGVSLDKVGALRGAIFGVSFLVGPAIAGWLLAVLPAIQVVWITAVCSAAAALATLVMPLGPATTAPRDDSPLAGIVHIRRSPALLVLLLVQLGSTALVAPLLSILLPAHFNAAGAPGELGATLSIYAVGTVVGSGLYGWLFGPRRWQAWAWALALCVVSAVLIATLGGFWLVAVGMGAAGLGSGLMQPLITVVLTRSIPDELRGRVFSVYSTLGLVVTPIGLGLISAVVAAGGLGVAACVLAVGWAVVACYGIWAPGMRDSLIQKEETGADNQATG